MIGLNIRGSLVYTRVTQNRMVIEHIAYMSPQLSILLHKRKDNEQDEKTYELRVYTPTDSGDKRQWVYKANIEPAVILHRVAIPVYNYLGDRTGNGCRRA